MIVTLNVGDLVLWKSRKAFGYITEITNAEPKRIKMHLMVWKYPIEPDNAYSEYILLNEIELKNIIHYSVRT